MSIERLVENYENICNQIKKHREDVALLIQRKNKAEEEIVSVLKRMDTDGITSGGKEVFVEHKLRKARMSKKQKQTEYMRIFTENGVPNPGAVFSALSGVGKSHEKSSVKMKPVSKK